MKYKSYSNYKDSGVEWLGEIPSEWENSKLKYHSLIYNGNSISDNEKSQYENLDRNFSVPYVSTKDINADYLSIDYENGMRISSNQTNFKIAKKGSTLLCIEGGSAGKKLGILDENVGFVNKLACIDANNLLDKKYSHYITRSSLFKYSFDLATTGLIPGVSINQLKDFEIILPPFQEQQQIADFLDKATSKIDKTIEKQTKLCELLKEKRQAVISHAVTKGLDSNVHMKDSGVEWLGEIPEHWDIGMLSTLFDNNKIKNTGMKNNNLLSLSYGKIIKKRIDTAFGLLPESFETYQIVKPGYIILRLTDLQNDKKSLRTGLVTQEGIITSAYVGLKKKSKSIGNEKFIHYYLHTFDIYKGFYGMGSGVRQSLNFDELKKLKFVLPPLIEQDSIVDYIDEKTSKIDNLIEKSNKAIALLKEKRTSLISSAVTGKIDVRDLI